MSLEHSTDAVPLVDAPPARDPVRAADAQLGAVTSLLSTLETRPTVALPLLDAAELLTEAEREIFISRYCQIDGPPETLRSLAVRLAITRESVRQLEIRAARRLAPDWQVIAHNQQAVLFEPN